jgi:hypothetical protein
MVFDKSNYFLGKVFDPKTKTLTDDPVLLEPSNLTTHCVVTGMTGSGKTGLCIGLLEEAALHNTPAIIIDPKGDLTNLVLHFPNQQPADFEPWIDPEVARQEGKTVAQMAEETAARWKKGLADWGMGAEQLQELADAAEYAIYSPGSNAGFPVNILSSFEVPSLSWEDYAEVLRERISTTITAILGLIGITNIDPLRSREHILLSNLIENAWVNGNSLTLTDLILQVQNPPLERLGAFPMDSFFPEKDRFELAILLNNFLASPSFQVWQQGQPLDIQQLLYTKDGRPRHSIFYLAHLSENERMFFVTLLFAAVESWMRGQRGTGNLRAILYFDEIMGYLPPVANPPSKTVMLRMLKQARAFGVGLLLATQNPVDVDYKALSNAGTWMIGRLQTEQDKNRLLDGLTSAGGTTDIGTLDKMISGLGKRIFLLHSVYKSTPVLFNTRWAMNYLAGPMTRDQLPAANALAGAIPAYKGSTTGDGRSTGRPATSIRDTSGLSNSRPAIPGDIAEYYVPNNLGISEAAANAGLSGVGSEGLVYRPGIIAQAEVRYLSRQYNLEHTRKTSAILEDPGSGLIRWENLLTGEFDKHHLDIQPLPKTQYHPVPSWLADPKRVDAIKKDFLDWIYRSGGLKLFTNAKLKLYGESGMSESDFRAKSKKAVEDAVKIEIAKAVSTLDTKIAAMERKVESQQLDVKAADSSVKQRRLETLATGGSAVIGMLSGRKRSITSTLSKNRMASAAKDRLDAEETTLKQYMMQLEDLKKSKFEVENEVRAKWEGIAEEISEITIKPTKSDIFSDIFAVAWLPYYIVEVDGKKLELPAFKR